jgi:hypothetical protein
MATGFKGLGCLSKRLVAVMGVVLLGIGTLRAARPICSRCYSVWCHDGVFGTRCAVFDENGNKVGDLGPGATSGSVSDWCEYVNVGGGCR